MVALMEKEDFRRRIPNAHMLMMLKKVFDDAAAGFKNLFRRKVSTSRYHVPSATKEPS
jgi:hypothetical protein